MTLQIQGYLTERKLADALRLLVGERWAGDQVLLPGSRRRVDLAYRDRGSFVLVEYDGDDHYRDSMKIKADRQKDSIAAANGMRLVRVPYWVQLDSVMARHWFDVDVAIEQSFPHGFITTKLFPASYCELGVVRFLRELDALPPEVNRAVILSLRDRASEHGIEYVLPSALHGLIST